MNFINVKGNLVSIETPLVMGIINITTDSFYVESRHSTIDNVLLTAEKMIEDGASILDIGGQSTRPGSTVIGDDDECNAILPAIEAIAKRFPQIVISVDTYYSKVAGLACDAGAGIVNDISGGFDENMFTTVANKKAVYILMHIKGNPSTMHTLNSYNNIVPDITDYMVTKTASCRQAGIKDVIADIGIGFSKTLEDNYYLLNHLDEFKVLHMPLLVGISRKSFIYKLLQTDAANALNGTSALHLLSLMKGANLLSVHDVKEAVEIIKIAQALG